MREEEHAVTSNGMNDDCTNNIHCSDSDNNRNGDVNFNLNQISQVWGTWEELLLTCAVKRHGSKDWDFVAKEVGSRSSLNASAPICKLKYQDLKRRFQNYVADDGNREAVAEDDTDGEIPWLEQLRSLRIAELRREVQRRDDTILSLQLKVKKLEDEKDGDNKPDLEPLNDETEPTRLNQETTESDHRSIHESNSTASVDKIADHERVSGNNMVHANENSRNPDPDPAHKEEEGTVSRRSETSHSGELGESGTSTGHLKRKGHNYSGEDNRIRGGSGGNIKPAGDKSQPLIEIIKLIRSHPRGSMFGSRLRSQETKDYKRLIRQHLDIKTIEKKLEKGSYVSSSLSFYRDLKILFTNAIVFFPSSSSEYMAAQELSTLVSNEMKKKTGKSTHCVIKEEAESSGPPHVVCQKKSSGSKKTVPSSTSLKQKDEKKSHEVSEEKKTVTTTSTGARSSRRTSKGMDVVVAKDAKIGRARNNKNKQTDSSCDDDEEETHKTEKKISSEKKKSVAEFLKRIKKNSPQKKSDGDVKKENSKAKPRELRSKKKVEVEINSNNKSSSKRKQLKKETDEVTAAVATGKRGRESGKDNQQPKKRSRR